jgi:hypothetical protein
LTLHESKSRVEQVLNEVSGYDDEIIDGQQQNVYTANKPRVQELEEDSAV